MGNDFICLLVARGQHFDRRLLDHSRALAYLNIKGGINHSLEETKMKSTFLAALALISFAGGAEAARRPDTRTMTCAQAREFVIANSPVVMTYGYSRKAGPLYSKFSAHACRRHDRDDVYAWVPTLDSPSCYIGYVCNN